MPPPSTLRADRVPDWTGCVFQTPVPPEPAQPHVIVWHLLTTVLWAVLGIKFAEYLPLPMLLLPAWLLARTFWPMFLALFAAGVYTHWLYVCTASLLPEDRARSRRGAYVAAFIRVPFALLLFPWSLWCCVRRPAELTRAWHSFFTYNRQGIVGPGLLQSPVGTQMVRVWWYRGTVFLVAAATLGLPWPDIDQLGPTETLILLGLALNIYTPGVAVLTVGSLVLGPSLKRLQEDRHA